jgi:hypothetical protein
MQAAYEKASREIKNQLTLAEKYSSYLSYAGILATGVSLAAPYLIPAYVTTLFAMNVLAWALPLASAAVSTADRWFNKYDTMSYEQKAYTISNLNSIVALAGTAITKNETWLKTGLYGTVPIPKSSLIVSQIVVPLGVKALTLYLRHRDINQDTNTTAFNRSLAKEINNTEYTRHATSGGATTIEDIRTKGKDNDTIPHITVGQRMRR